MSDLLTVAHVIDWVSRIRDQAGDDEVAHSNEDALHVRVLQAIALGECSDPVACAREALKSIDIEFARWCA